MPAPTSTANDRVDNEWSPHAVPAEWKRAAADRFGDAIGMSAAPGPGVHPDGVAFAWYPDEHTERTLTYKTAHERAAEIAAVLRAACVQAFGADAADDEPCTVGLLLRRTAALPISELAAFKAGMTFVPIDPSWPEPRIADILEQTRVCALVCDDGADATPAEFDTDEVVLVELSETAEVVRVGAPRADALAFEQHRSAARAALFKAAKIPKVGSRDVGGVGGGAPPPPPPPLPWRAPEAMYVMFTSGSTGKPKGCIVPSAGVHNELLWAIEQQAATRDDVFLLKTTCTFDVSIHEMWQPLLLGARSVVLRDGAQLDFDETAETMERGGVTSCHFVPSLLALFLDSVRPGACPALRQVITIGEALLSTHRAKLSGAIGSRVQLLNMYGPTEASIVVTCFDAKDPEPSADGAPAAAHGFAIGGAMPGVHIYITDPSDPTALVPDGEKGEICIGGVQVAYGYLGRHALTAEKFLRNPHGAPGLMYRTGDLGIRDGASGIIEYNGRADRQVKVGGVRIELGEVEAVVLEVAPALSAAAVEKVDGQLVGVASTTPGRPTPSAGELSVLLARRLPAAYIPAEWFFIEAMPLNNAGKVDHRAVAAYIDDQRKAARWGAVYNEMYFSEDLQVSDGQEDPTMDWASYYDSFTGKMHERRTIAEWVQHTADEILERKPDAVIEMGCGKGMILFKWAASPRVVRAVGTDIARLAVEYVERTWRSHFGRAALGPAGHGKLKMHVRDAANFSGFDDGEWSSIVCNGVSMYFPSVEYTAKVLKNGLPKLAPGGCFHFGDVRSLAHQRLFCVRRARHLYASYEQCVDRAFQDAELAKDKDRCFDPALFYALALRGELPGVSAVEVQLKRDRLMTEFGRYRYNVLLHTGPAEAALPLREVAPPAAAEGETAGSIAAALRDEVAAAERAGAPPAVVARFGVRNARLTADVLLVSGAADAAAPAVQDGVGEGGGIDPADLRDALAAALPDHHAVLTWSRANALDELDCYLLPRAHMIGGLRAVMRAAMAGEAEQALLSAPALDLESFSNRAAFAVEAETKTNDGKATGLKEARALWAEGAKRDAVVAVLQAVIGGTALAESGSFADAGGNSFSAMECVAALRDTLGLKAPVFALLTKTLGSFIDDVAASAGVAKGGAADAPRWVTVSQPYEGVFRAVSDAERPQLPTFVLFPMAGGSPKQFAHTYLRLRELEPRARFLFVSPPGRDERAAEPSESSLDAYIGALTAELQPLLTAETAPRGPCVFVGDSWGALAAYATAHALRKATGFEPSAFVASGNAAPAIAEGHTGGLGSYAPHTPCSALTDEQLAEFLRSSGVPAERLAAGGAGLAELLAPLRADLALYEAFVRPDGAETEPLHCNAVILRGADDRVVTAAEMRGWLDEFDGEELAVVSVRGASHHVYEDAPARAAEHLARLVTGEHGGGAAIKLTGVRAASKHEWSVRPSAKGATAEVLARLIGPPCSFIKQCDSGELHAYRQGNIRYRCGAPWGSKGEVAYITTTPAEQQQQQQQPAA